MTRDDFLAAEYVIGTLDAAERAEVRTRMGVDVAFEAKVRRWERALAPLYELVTPIAPPEGLWRVIADDLNNVRSGRDGERRRKKRLKEKPSANDNSGSTGAEGEGASTVRGTLRAPFRAVSGLMKGLRGGGKAKAEKPAEAEPVAPAAPPSATQRKPLARGGFAKPAAGSAGRLKPRPQRATPPVLPPAADERVDAPAKPKPPAETALNVTALTGDMRPAAAVLPDLPRPRPEPQEAPEAEVAPREPARAAKALPAPEPVPEPAPEPAPELAPEPAPADAVAADGADGKGAAGWTSSATPYLKVKRPEPIARPANVTPWVPPKKKETLDEPPVPTDGGSDGPAGQDEAAESTAEDLASPAPALATEQEVAEPVAAEPVAAEKVNPEPVAAEVAVAAPETGVVAAPDAVPEPVVAPVGVDAPAEPPPDSSPVDAPATAPSEGPTPAESKPPEPPPAPPVVQADPAVLAVLPELKPEPLDTPPEEPAQPLAGRAVMPEVLQEALKAALLDRADEAKATDKTKDKPTDKSAGTSTSKPKASGKPVPKTASDVSSEPADETPHRAHVVRTLHPARTLSRGRRLAWGAAALAAVLAGAVAIDVVAHWAGTVAREPRSVSLAPIFVANPPPDVRMRMEGKSGVTDLRIATAPAPEGKIYRLRLKLANGTTQVLGTFASNFVLQADLGALIAQNAASGARLSVSLEPIDDPDAGGEEVYSARIGG